VAQLIQIAGAVLILAAYTGAQLRRLDQHSPGYLWANLVGSGVLAALAWLEGQWGFVLLESVWAAVSGWGLLSLLRGPQTTDSP